MGVTTYGMKFKNDDCSLRLIEKINSLNKTTKHKVILPKIYEAIYYIKKYHKNQKRHSGEPYYYHPLEVASKVIDCFFDTETIVAALLHDLAEDTEITINHIELIFGEKVAQIVDALTKITMNYQLSKEEIFYKINCFNHLEKKAVIIKIADRLHNMETIQYITSLDKQKRTAQETLQIYVPLARLVGLTKMADQLESLSIKILNL